MRSRRSLILSAFLLAGVLALTACPSQTTINKINADPGRYRDKEVAIVGTVTESYGVLNQGAYEIDDGTGKMWVLASRAVPSRGARVGVKGRVYSGLTFRGRNFGVGLRESDRRSK